MLNHSTVWFGIVGVVAAVVHYGVAVQAEHAYLAPGWANIVGFICAFPVSYFGHRFFSFAAQKTTHRAALPKFFLVAVGSFIANHLLLLTSLHFTHYPFWLVLGCVMVIVAVSTYFLSRFWAFKSVDIKKQ